MGAKKGKKKRVKKINKKIEWWRIFCYPNIILDVIEGNKQKLRNLWGGDKNKMFKLAQKIESIKSVKTFSLTIGMVS